MHAWSTSSSRSQVIGSLPRIYGATHPSEKQKHAAGPVLVRSLMQSGPQPNLQISPASFTSYYYYVGLLEEELNLEWLGMNEEEV